jgi:hypothetical protein
VSGSPPGSTTQEVTMSTTIVSSLRTATAAVVVAASAVATGSAAVADPQAAQERYVGSLVVQARDASTYTQMDDYVRGLEYWAEHPDWGLGS